MRTLDSGDESRLAVAHCRFSLRERMLLSGYVVSVRCFAERKATMRGERVLLSAYVVSVRSFAERKATMKGSPWDAP